MVLSLMVAGCAASKEAPTLPSEPAAVAETILSPTGQDFLRDVTGYAWDDGGRRAGASMSWIAVDAHSPDPSIASRAGETASAIAAFLADDKMLGDPPANPELWQSYSTILAPYLGAMVDDDGGVTGFVALDDFDSPMRRTVGLFVAMSRDADAFGALATSASTRATGYEHAFAHTVAEHPSAAYDFEVKVGLFRAARLRAVVATAPYVAQPNSRQPTPTHEQTQVAYDVASVTARAGTDTIDRRFFGADGRLLAPDDVGTENWSVYDAQLTVYLAPLQPIIDVIRQYGRAFDGIVLDQ
ncbi:hypothetical protein [Mycolicibacterium sediminis]|nr:hypothetical protein [Mycolicibacterium sediminis]